jgi:hypothetical protein
MWALIGMIGTAKEFGTQSTVRITIERLSSAELIKQTRL